MQETDNLIERTGLNDHAEELTTASELNAKSMLAEMIRRAMPRKGKHNKARVLRAKAKQQKRKANRK